MPAEWRTAALGELADIFDGPHATPTKTEAGPIFLGISSLDNGRITSAGLDHLSEEDYKRWTRRVEPRAGDLVFSYETRLGEAAMIPPGFRCCLGRRMGLLRARPGAVDERFLLYAYLGPKFQRTLRSRTIHGSTVDRIPLTDLSAFPIEIPSRITEQRAIAQVLGSLDDKIELNRRMKETLEDIARALFKSWFVDFDPVRAKAEGRDTGLPGRVADLFPDSFEESELGEIPKGWQVKLLPDVIAVNPARALHKGDIAPYLDMANMPTRGHTPDVVVDRAFGSGMRFMNGDTLVARITPCLENGKTAFVDFLAKGQVGWGSTEYIVLHPKSPLPVEFAYCLARGAGFRDFAVQSMTGSSGRQRGPAESLDHYQIATPRPEIAAHFGRTARLLFARASAGACESRTLASLRDALLPKLVSGEVRALRTGGSSMLGGEASGGRE